MEDNEKNLKLFKVLINFLGHESIAARNGEDGIKLAKESFPDLVLMDIQMPLMDGVSALKILRSEEITRNIPVIALTSYALNKDKEKFLEIGFSDYIPKPIEKDDFLEIIKKILKKEGMENE